MSLQALERKKEEQRHLHEENLRINAGSIRTKEQRREEEKQLDMRDMEYMKKKLVSSKDVKQEVKPESPVKDAPPLQEREAEYEAQQKRVKKEKELEITRLRAQQERAKDYKAEQVSADSSRAAGSWGQSLNLEIQSLVPWHVSG